MPSSSYLRRTSAVRVRLSTCLAAAVGVFAAGALHAQSVWTDGNGNHQLSQNGNWMSGTAPANDGDLQFNGAGTNEIVLDIPTYLAHSVSFSGPIGYTVSGYDPSYSLQFDGGGSAFITNTASSTITMAVPITLNGAITINNSGSPIIMVGNVSGSGPVTLTTGNLFLTGANTYSGTTTINSGAALSIGNGSTTGSSLTGDVVNNGTLFFLPAASDAQAYTGAISGSGGVTFNGTGMITLGGTNTYSGPTTVNTGTLADSSPNAFSPNSDMIVNSAGGSLQVNYSEAIGALQNGGNGGPVSIAQNAILTSNGDSYFGDYLGVISGAGSILVNGKQGFAGNNTYSGGTEVSEGAEISLGSNSAVGTGTLTFDPGSEFTLTNNVTLANPVSLKGEGDIENDDGGYNNLTLTGPITGGGGLEWCTSGTLTLTNSTNSFTGGVDARTGTVIIGASGAAGTGQITVDTGATFKIGSGATVTNYLNFDGLATLGGNGTVGALFYSASHVIISPTSASGGPGNLTFSQGLSVGDGTAIHFELYDANGAAGTGYSLISTTDFLSSTASPGGITFNLVTTDINGQPANALNFNASQPYSWTVFAASSAPYEFSANQFNLITGGFTNATNGGSFNISISGDNILLNFTPVPEPSTWALIGLGLAVVIPVAWRRRKAIRA